MGQSNVTRLPRPLMGEGRGEGVVKFQFRLNPVFYGVAVLNSGSWILYAHGVFYRRVEQVSELAANPEL